MAARVTCTICLLRTHIKHCVLTALLIHGSALMGFFELALHVFALWIWSWICIWIWIFIYIYRWVENEGWWGSSTQQEEENPLAAKSCEAARLGINRVSIWNLTGASPGVLLKHLSNEAISHGFKVSHDKMLCKHGAPFTSIIDLQ